jgi:hypothetical protein
MDRNACGALLGTAAIAVCVLAWLSASAHAGEASYCVTCSGPDQIYRCRVTGEGSKPSDALTQACTGVEKVYAYDGPDIPDNLAQDPRVKNLMSKVEHDNKQFAKPKGEAPQTMVELTGRAFSASRQGLRNARSAIGGSSDAPQPLPASPPPTGSMESAAAAAPGVDSPSRMQRASAAMGSAARKSYRCLRSLFRNCSGETASGSTVQ